MGMNGCATCLALIVTLVTTASSAAAGTPPNILFIAVDDLNSWVGCIGGHPQVKTPHMDRLARRGAVFLNAHCQAPLCNPSRTSLLTGLRPSTTGVYALQPWFRTVEDLKDHVTLPQYFAAHGYRTLTTGKIYHDGYPPLETRASSQEFTVWGHPGSHGPRPDKKLVQTPSDMWLIDWGIHPEHDQQMEDYRVTDWAVQQLRTLPKEEPFFLCVGLRRPHLPCLAPQKWFDLYPPATLQLPPVKQDDRQDTPRFSWYLHWTLPEPRLSWLQEHQQWTPLVRAYLACISFTDSQVGRLLDALETSGRADDTIVVLWSDHGWHLGEKGITGKTTLWDCSTRVPLIYAGPGIAAGIRSDQPVELLDIYPSLAELCGLPAPEKVEGHSLVPLLKQPGVSRAWPAITTHGPNNHAVRTERWRYIRYADGSEELYDEKADPNEWNNLACDPGLSEIKHQLAQWLPKVSRPPLLGSKSRLIELQDGVPFWEGTPIDPLEQPH